MPKVSGLGDNFYLDGYDLSGDTSALGSLATPINPIEVTGIDKSAIERLAGLRDGNMEWVSYFNPAALQAHAALSPLPTTDRIASYFHNPAIGSPAFSMIGKQVGYDPTRADDGALTFAVTASSNAYAAEWGQQLTAGKVVITGAGAQASIDGNNYGTSGTTNFGLQAYLHVFAFTGTSATVTIQSSTDDGAGDAFTNVTGAAFTAATGRTFERIQTGRTQAVERYLRASVAGTFSSFTFAVMVVRNSAAEPF
jgi:hypothetical protein